jgi:Ca-activated chloride channel family protein
MRLFSILCAIPLFLLFLSNLALADGRTIIVLDGSGSMWGQIDGKPKLEIAREALAEVLKTFPADTELGLIAYGHRSKGSCDDIETLVAPATGTAPAIAAAADKMQFLGKTPLTDAVRRAAAELHSTEEKATVVLITDGIETCEGDPCALAQELETSGVDFTAHVVGFGLTKDEGNQVACLAEDTGGQYITADDLDSLTVALQATVISAPAPAPEPVPVPKPSKPAQLKINFAPKVLLAPGVAKPDDTSQVNWEIYAINPDGSTSDRVTTEYNDFKGYIEPGRYRLITTLDSTQATTDITLTADTLSAPEVVVNAARVILHPKGTEGGEIEPDASLNFTTTSGLNTTFYGDTRVYLPAGEVTLTAGLGLASQTETLALTPGQLLEKDEIIQVGLAAIEGYYVEGMVIEGTAHQISIRSAKKSIDGSRENLTTAYGTGNQTKLSPGDYIAYVELGAASAEVPFSIKAGERTDVAVILEAGVLAFTAPGASEVQIFSAKKDINGNRKSLFHNYNAEDQTTLPGGDYAIVITKDGTETETLATVKPGERTEINMP